jgi:hypothetical protein
MHWRFIDLNQRFLPGLVTIDGEARSYDDERSGPETQRSGSDRRCVGPQSGPGRPTAEPLFAQPSGENSTLDSTDRLDGTVTDGGEHEVVVEPAAAEAS